MALIQDLVKSSKALYIGIKRITRLGDGRYTIYLPTPQNDLWDELWRRGVKVRVYLEIVENSKESSDEE